MRIFRISIASLLLRLSAGNVDGPTTTVVSHGESTDLRSASMEATITAQSQAVITPGVSLNTKDTTTNCSASWSSWLEASIQFSLGTYVSFTSTRTYYNITAKTTKLCDGHTRIVGGLDGLTTTATGTTTFFTFGLSTFSGSFTPPTPTCIPPPADRTNIFSGFFVWVPRTKGYNKSQFPSTLPSSLQATGQICGHCSIFGGTVQLLYFPSTTESSHNLCPTNSPGSPTLCPLAPTRASYHVANPYEMSPCAYITSDLTSTKNSGPYIISAGQTFYRNRAYISLQTAYAKDECGFIGGQHTGTFLTLQSSEIFSVGGYHHQFSDIGYSINYADFETVPAAAYYQGCNSNQASATLCSYTGTRYRYSTDFINGMNTVDFGNVFQQGTVSNQWIWDEAYAPTLVVPLQMRQLDPAWSTCSWNLNGLYDPPRVLSAEQTYAKPTYPGTTTKTASTDLVSATIVSIPSSTAQPGASIIVPSITPSAYPKTSTTPASPTSGQPPPTSDCDTSLGSTATNSWLPSIVAPIPSSDTSKDPSHSSVEPTSPSADIQQSSRAASNSSTPSANRAGARPTVAFGIFLSTLTLILIAVNNDLR